MKITSDGLKSTIDRRRDELGLTQEKLASRVGMSRQLMLGRLAKVDATGSLRLAYRLAKALRVPVSVLLDEAEKDTRKIKRRKGRKK